MSLLASSSIDPSCRISPLSRLLPRIQTLSFPPSPQSPTAPPLHHGCVYFVHVYLLSLPFRFLAMIYTLPSSSSSSSLLGGVGMRGEPATITHHTHILTSDTLHASTATHTRIIGQPLGQHTHKALPLMYILIYRYAAIDIHKHINTHTPSIPIHSYMLLLLSCPCLLPPPPHRKKGAEKYPPAPHHKYTQRAKSSWK